MRPKLRIWRFSYGADGSFYDPAWPTLTVRARTRREARKRAEVKAQRLLNQHRARWEWLDGDWRELPPVKGGVMSWSKGEIAESHWERKRREKAWRERASRPVAWPKALGGSREAFSAFIAPTIQQVIEQAPVFADLFGKDTHQLPDGVTIPLARLAYTRARPSWTPQP